MDCFGVQADRSSYSFPKKERLTRGFQFKNVYQQGRTYKGRYLILVVLKNGFGANRVGISVAKSLIKKASQRNRLARIFKEAYRYNKDKATKGYDIVLRAGQSCLKQGGRLNPQIIEKELLVLLKKAGVSLN